LPDEAFNIALQFVQLFMLSNLVLGLFNLLPIPPLDGGRIAVGLLPLPLARIWARLERAGIVIVILVLFLLPPFLADVAHVHFDPLRDALGVVVPRAFDIILTLAGIDGRDV
jgi:Zn-dependent protease